MLIFVYEHMNSGAYASGAGAESLHAEGRAMLAAVLEDFRQCGVGTVTLLTPGQTAPGRVVHACGSAEVEAAFRLLARTADRTLVIAPETDGILETSCRWVEEENGCLLGPSTAAVRLTADKLALAEFLAKRGVPTPRTLPLATEKECPFPFPVVVKPRDGAGSLATFRIDAEETWLRLDGTLAAEGYGGELVVQPYVAGKPASVAILRGPAGIYALPPAEQYLSADDRCRYRGGSLSLLPNEALRARQLAERATAEVAGLRGFVGIDLVLGADEAGAGDAVIEINPRLTTSYVGLRELAKFNLAAAILAVADGAPAPAFQWHTGHVAWAADGSIRRSP